MQTDFRAIQIAQMVDFYKHQGLMQHETDARFIVTNIIKFYIPTLTDFTIECLVDMYVR
uniref:Uncharacterized protein n=1 Tax=viral metagenome TaxID=1070528 RepID=A0A6C0JX23_9ZZZZ